MTRDGRRLLEGFGSAKREQLGGFSRAEEELEHKTFMASYSRSQTKEEIMKLRTIALATALALSSTFALAQSGGGSAAGSAGGSSVAGGSAATGSATGSSMNGTTTGNAGATVTSPNNTQSLSGNTLGPKASPSGSTLTPAGPGSGLSK
jgi:hypothetical protein